MIDGLKPYPAMKDSGVPWLGEVPEHWGIHRLGALMRERGETNDDGRVTDVLSVMRERGVIPYAEKGNVGNKKSDDTTRYKVVRPDDIVVNCMNVIIGSVGISRYTGCLSPVYYVLTRRNANDSPHYLNAYFQAKSFQRSLVRIGNGILAHRMRIPMELLKCEMFPHPPIQEQSTIVRFLDHADQRIRRYIRTKQKLIKLLEEQKQAIILRAVTRGLDPNVRLKPSGLEWLGDVPEHWEVRKLGTLGMFFKGRGIARADITETGVPAITYGDIYTRYGVEVKVLSKCTSPEVAANAQEILRGDLLFTASGETIEEIGKTTLYSGDVPGYAGGDVIIFRLAVDYGLYISYVLNSDLGVRQKSALGRGDIIVHISATKLKQIDVPIPPQDEAIAIARLLDQTTANITNAIEYAHREISLLREYRTRLIADVVTGKLDVRGVAASLPKEADELETHDDADAEAEGDVDSAEGNLDVPPEEAEV
ncbi:MAG: restriction endonuclease subunit S [Deltaproteobacteria bacterium]|nr:restriction endonuclease subunit S [Deltaproteobacteria bacterium]